MNIFEKIYSDIISNNRPLFLVGSDKNSGKTTVLNALMKEFEMRNRSCSILSCGMDGETEDTVFGTEKPSIRVIKDDIFVTTWSGKGDLPSKLISSLPFQITGKKERLGIWKSQGAGDILLTGGVSVKEIWDIIERLKKLSNNQILVDGALDRWAALFGGDSKFILVAGGKSFSNIESAGNWLNNKLEILNLPIFRGKLDSFNYEELMDSENMPESVKFQGALTDRCAAEMVSKGAKTIVVNSPSHIFCSLKILKNIKVLVERKSLPVAIAVNPEKHGSSQFSSKEMVDALMKIAGEIPVIDILTLEVPI